MYEPTFMDKVIDALINQGITGVFVLAMGWYILRMQDKHEKERAEFNNKWEATTDRMNTNSEKQTGLMESLKTLLDERLKK